jgi:uncharacterized protein DUF2510
VTGRVAPGWYPDYEAPPGHQRYWDGERWTERRSRAPRRRPTRRAVAWAAAGVAVGLGLTAAVLVLADDDTSSGRGSAPPAASTPGAPASTGTGSASPTPGDGAGPRTWEVASVRDDATLELAAGPLVRLVGLDVDGDCATSALAALVEGQRVALVRPGADKDTDGRLLRYAELDGVDVGLRLIQRGVAAASDDAHPRGAIYRRVDTRSPDAC